MRLSELMHTDVAVTHPGEAASKALKLMQAKKLEYLVVLQHGRTLGVLTRHELEGSDGGELVSERMAPQSVSASPATTAHQAAKLLRGRASGCLPVLDGHKLVGLVTTADLLERLAKASPVRKAREHPGKRVIKTARWPHRTPS